MTSARKTLAPWMLAAFLLVTACSGFPAANDAQVNGQAAPPAGWLQASEAGVSYAYPQELPTEYISAVDWPPGVQVLDGPLSPCVEAGSEIERAGRTESRNVNGVEYCRTTILEGAAGSVYGMYAYAFAHGNRTVIFTFTTRAVQCGNYDEPAHSACLTERETFDLDALVHRMAGTLTAN